MKREISPATKVALLSEDSVRPWPSLAERRRCILCDRVFDGAAVRVAATRRGRIFLRCPTRGCPSDPRLWIHPDDPLMSSEAWYDWIQVIDRMNVDEEEETAVASIVPRKSLAGGESEV